MFIGNKMLQRLKTFFADILFPRECLVCGKDGEIWCNDCQKKVIMINENICLICNQNTAEDGVCDVCQKSSSFNSAVAVCRYKGQMIETVIHKLKYDFIEELAKELANLLVVRLEKYRLVENVVCIPIALHKKRLLERGFNQSALIAKYVAENLCVDYREKALIRCKNTKQQAKLIRNERIENLQQAFVCNEPELIKNKTIILIDDVITTGATFDSAAECLKMAGAGKIIVAAVAHG